MYIDWVWVQGVCVDGVVGAGSVCRWCGGCRECV